MTKFRLPPPIADSLPPAVTSRIFELAAAGTFSGDELTEIRLRTARPASLSAAGNNLRLGVTVSAAEMADTVASLCRGSVYAHDADIREGYIRMEGGIRVGVCGTMAGKGVRDITSLNIRIPHAIRGVCEPILPLMEEGLRSLLIHSPPGVGKTTLLRDLAARLAMTRRVVLMDTRGELYMPELFADTLCDVLTGYPRALGIEIATRTLSPEVIVCDELGDLDEARGLLTAVNTGVPIIATAHAADAAELTARPNIRLLHDNGVFDAYVGIARERIGGRLSRSFTCSVHRRDEAIPCRA